jgi:hypothetical protein
MKNQMTAAAAMFALLTGLKSSTEQNDNSEELKAKTGAPFTIKLIKADGTLVDKEEAVTGKLIIALALEEIQDPEKGEGYRVALMIHGINGVQET